VIRLARAKDVPALQALIEACIGNGIPHTRKATQEEVLEFARSSYAELETMLKQPDLVVLVEESAGQLSGYLMLDFAHVEASTGERQCFIVDLGVDPAKRGRFGTHRLIKKASQLAAARGLDYLVGMVSASNDRTLQLGLKALDFEIERYQIVRRCR
jgi:N-acetylglutamate synthase-like GNAT family acetyltransferase